MKSLNRRSFLKKSSSTAAAALVGTQVIGQNVDLEPKRPPKATYMGDFAAKALPKVHVAIIGVGARGSGHIKDFASLEGVEVVAICDLYEDLVKKSKKAVEEIGKGERHTNIKTYFGKENLWLKMLNEVKPDMVVVATNWMNHAKMCIESMKAGAHAFVEVPIAVSMEEMWQIIDTSELTQKHCMMMENVNYGRDELMFLNMCRLGIIGEVIHGEAAYIHELRFQMYQDERGTGSWRTPHYAQRNGNLYPTHGLGPVAQYMNIGRGEDNFESMVSYSTPALGRQKYAKKKFDKDHKWNKLNYEGGDLNTSIIKTHIGRTILVQWDETSPRPYSRLNLIQGTTGTLAGFPTRVALEGGMEGATENHHQWIEGDKLATLYDKYDHPLYKRLNNSTKNSGHGGMDGIMRYRIIECLRNGLPLDQNVYEGCLWSAVTPLSERSVAAGGAPQAFPDFTRGNWKNTQPLKLIE